MLKRIFNYFYNQDYDFQDIKRIAETCFSKDEINKKDLLETKEDAKRYLDKLEKGRDTYQTRYQNISFTLFLALAGLFTADINIDEISTMLVRYILIGIGIGISCFAYISTSLYKQKIFACYRIIHEVNKKLSITISFFDVHTGCIRNGKGLTQKYFSVSDILAREVILGLLVYIIILLVFVVSDIYSYITY